MQGLEYTKEFVDFSDKPEWIKNLTEKGTVPVLKDGEGEFIPDSADICQYLQKTYPSPDLGKCTLEGIAEKLFPSAFLNFLKAKQGEDHSETQELEGQLQELEDYLGKSGPYLGGDNMMAYDAMMVRACTLAAM